jgi:folylpolyglutamate synthase
MTMQRVFADKWRELDPSANIMLIPSIEEAISTARTLAKDNDPKVQALITGSLHLVGGALGILEGADAL